MDSKRINAPLFFFFYFSFLSSTFKLLQINLLCPLLKTLNAWSIPGKLLWKYIFEITTPLTSS